MLQVVDKVYVPSWDPLGQYVLESPVSSPKSSPMNPESFHYDEPNNQLINGYHDVLMDEMMINYNLGLPLMENYWNIDYNTLNELQDSSKMDWNGKSEIKSEKKEEKGIKISREVAKKSENKTNNKNNKKRKRTDENKVSDTNSVFLSREELLNISSTDLEARIAVITSQRPLTSSEIKEIKKQKRLVKNREYSQQSRAKKKVRLQELEETVNQLNDENKALKQDIYNLQCRIKFLEEQKQNPEPQDFPLSTSEPQAFPLSTSEPQAFPRSTSEPQEDDYHSNWHQALFFIILFSFGILFNIGISDPNKAQELKFKLPKDNFEKVFRPRDLLQLVKTEPNYSSLSSREHLFPNFYTMDDVDSSLLLANQCINSSITQLTALNLTYFNLT